MKIIFAAVLSALVVLITLTQSVGAQKTVKDGSTGLLFQITGKGLAKPSYIFGTFHVLCPTDMIPLEKFTPYIDQADQLVMELDMDDPAETASIQKSALITDGHTLKDALTPQQYAKVDEMIKNSVGVSADALQMFKPTILGVVVLTSPKMLGCTSSSYDLSLAKIAGEKKKPIYGLETAAFQGQTLDAKPLAKQAKELYEISLDPQKAENDLKRLIETYKTEDIEKIHAVATEDEKNDFEFEKDLLDDRNKAWIPKIETYIKDRPTFIAVGAGHLGGNNGIVNMLRSRGYKLMPIKL